MSDYTQDEVARGEIEIEQRLRELKRVDEGKQLARQIADYLNGHKSRFVVMGMAEQHRTLQQAFTRLCIDWLEHCADLASKGPGYYDLRNQASVELAKKLSETEVWQEAKYLPYI